jgi:hypothetical protein
MGNHHNGHTEFFLELKHEVQNLRLNGDIESGRRFVAINRGGLQERAMAIKAL